MTRRSVARLLVARLLQLPPLALTGWAFGQGLQYHLPWLSFWMAVAALCLVASYWLSYTFGDHR